MKGRQPQSKPEIWIAPGMLALTVIMIDQVTKAWAIANLGPEPRSHEITLIGDWFSLHYIRNTGVAFGLFQHMPQVFTVTSILITIAAIYAYRYHLPSQNRWIQICLGFIVGGALGNIIDRIRLGYVVDFVRVGWWPVFNMADSAVTVGVTMLASYLILVGDERPLEAMPHDDRLLADLLSHDPDR